MENASKALLIAGEILIAIVILSIGVYLYTTFNNVSEEYNKEIKFKQILEFNQNFTKYQNRENITIQEIITIANFAKEQKQTVNVFIGALNINNFLTNFKEEDYLKIHLQPNESIEAIQKFKVETIQYDIEGKVNLIRFKLIN